MYTIKANKPTKLEFDILNRYKDKTNFFKYNIVQTDRKLS